MDILNLQMPGFHSRPIEPESLGSDFFYNYIFLKLNHRFNGHELGQTPGDGKGQGSLACCSPWGRKELDTTW